VKRQLVLMSGLLAWLLGATSALAQGRPHAPTLARPGEVLAVETATMKLWRIDPVNLGSESISATALHGSVLSFDRAGGVLVIGDGVQRIDFETREASHCAAMGSGKTSSRRTSPPKAISMSRPRRRSFGSTCRPGRTRFSSMTLVAWIRQRGSVEPISLRAESPTMESMDST